MSALGGVRVLELAEGVAGEYCGKLLADFGAEVVKIERPDGGSPTRGLGPFAAGGSDPERSGLFAYLNTNKRSAVLDLNSEAGRAAVRELARRFDVVIDDHPSGWLADFGLDADSVAAGHSGLVVCSITAYGQNPPPDRVRGEDINAVHMSGWGYHTPTGANDTKPPLSGPGRFLASYEAALDGALCIAAAVFDKMSSGKSRFIDISKQAVLTSRVDYVVGQMVAGDMDVSVQRTAFDLSGPAGIFPCRNGYVYIWLSAPSHWEGLRALLGDPLWMRDFPPHWLERDCTPERVATCRRHLGEWLMTQDKDVAAELAQKLGVTLAPVYTAKDTMASPQFVHRRFFQTVEHPLLGALIHPTAPYRLSETPVHICAPAPLLGQNTAEVLEETPS